MRKLLVSVASLLHLVSLASAQSTVYVPCWTERKPQIYRSTQVKGTVVSSATGERAYVTVAARADGGSCSNVTRLYVAGPAGEFRKVFEAQPTKTDDGNGMRLIGWNRSGRKLLAELGRWPYGTDVGMGRELIVYDAKSRARFRTSISMMPCRSTLVRIVRLCSKRRPGTNRAPSL